MLITPAVVYLTGNGGGAKIIDKFSKTEKLSEKVT